MRNDTTGSARRRKNTDSVRVNIKGAWTAIPNRLLTDKRLSRDARLLGCMLFLHAANAGVAFPSQEQLAEELSTEERTIVVRSIQRWLTELREAGWLHWKQTLRNNKYSLNHEPADASNENDTPSDSSDADAVTGTTQESSRATEGSPGDATQRSSRATPVSPSNTTQRSDQVIQESSSKATQRSAPLIAVSRGATGESSHTTQESPSTFIIEDSLDSDSSIDSSSSESMPTHHPDDDDDDAHTTRSRSSKKPRAPRTRNPQTETTRYLAERGISAAQEFRELPLEVAQRTWQEITSRDPDARPGVVVQALRAWVAHQTQPAASTAGTSHGPIDVERYTNGQYGDLFRRGGDADASPLHAREEGLP